MWNIGKASLLKSPSLFVQANFFKKRKKEERNQRRLANIFTKQLNCREDNKKEKKIWLVLNLQTTWGRLSKSRNQNQCSVTPNRWTTYHRVAKAPWKMYFISHVYRGERVWDMPASVKETHRQREEPQNRRSFLCKLSMDTNRLNPGGSRAVFSLIPSVKKNVPEIIWKYRFYST